jgi:hypothetical protein
MTTKNATHREPMSEAETLRVDLEQTRASLADTVQELSRRLNVPHRVKESAGNAGHRAADAAGRVGHRAAAVAGQTGERMRQVPGALMELPALGRRHPRVSAAVGGAVALCVGAGAWMARRTK